MSAISEILKLSVNEKLFLLDKIWKSIDEEKIKITPQQKKELDKRLKRIEKGQTKFYSWAEVKKALRKK